MVAQVAQLLSCGSLTCQSGGQAPRLAAGTLSGSKTAYCEGARARPSPMGCPSSLLPRCRYQDYQAADIPTVERDGVTVRVMAGASMGTDGPITMRNPGLLLDVVLSPGARFQQEVRAHCHVAVRKKMNKVGKSCKQQISRLVLPAVGRRRTLSNLDSHLGLAAQCVAESR